MTDPKKIYWCGVCRREVPASEVRGGWREGWEHTGGPCMGAEVYRLDPPSTADSGIQHQTCPM